MKLLIFLTVIFIDVAAQFSASGQTAILNAHNALRSKISKGTYVVKGTTKPAGSNILKMTWDPTLAETAQAHADKCVFTPSATSGIGENINMFSVSREISDIDQYGFIAANGWENQFQHYGWSSNIFNKAMVQTVGQASQMAWAKTGLIGCGIKNCGSLPKSSSNRVLVVCQYKARGNTLNQYIYTSGKTCSSCPSGTTCETDTGLCV
ncbi:hypothetical protein B9Z55_016978 [Caenorhabditis nigoni]|uniref:SCP domain-containing protein n=1 Tax=Caenorhabditis nigoni TaxID=1611254 RepID=A0A2G5T726_9PELO|nr:hypothetical protein B9Z55_016978 [Caenorhabditis nigoni]